MSSIMMGGRKMKEMNERSQDGVNQQQTRLAAGESKNSGTGLTHPAPRHSSFKGLAIGAAGLLLIGVLGFLPVNYLKNQAQQIVNDTLPGLSYAGEANASMAKAFNRTLLLVLTDNAKRRDQLQKEIDSLTQVTSERLDAYKKQIYTREDQALFDKVMERRAKYLAIRDRATALVESNRRQEGIAVYEAELLPVYDQYNEAVDNLLGYNTREGASRGQTIMTVCTVTEFAVAGIAILLFVFGFLFGLFK